MMFIAIGVIIIIMLLANRTLDAKKFVGELEPYFKFLMETDYEFLLNVKYGTNSNLKKRYNSRVVYGLIALFVVLLLALPYLNKYGLLAILLALAVGFAVFKYPYIDLSGYYKRHLSRIDSLLPYYLKSLEILVQHYTVPVALRRSVDTAPEIFRDGLEKLVKRIEDGDSTVEPYMDFAKEYPVRDSMRMMRLLYRLSLGSQENKQEQLMMFSRTVSSLQNKSREIKYKNRLETMEKKTMTMLMCTGAGIIGLLMYSLMGMMSI